jgi:hypothetical protein
MLLNGDALKDEAFLKAIEQIPDDVLQRVQFSMPWQEPNEEQIRENNLQKGLDEDGFPLIGRVHGYRNYAYYQKLCLQKYEENPQISVHIRDVMGNLSGSGFSVTSEIEEIEDYLEELFNDPINNLWLNIPKYVGRAEIDGELFKILTIHDDGYVEVDFVDPSTLIGGEKDTGIIFHPTKENFPLAYVMQVEIDNQSKQVLIPSINIAYMPSLKKDLDAVLRQKKWLLDENYAKSNKPIFKSSFEGYYRFMVNWDKSLFEPRNVSHIKTTLKWLNYYEDLKKYEIDHKKSAGSYLWVAKFEDMKAFRLWVSLSDAERKKTGIMEKKAPGGTIVLPPGMDFTCTNPNLQKISDQDTDILQMVISGLGKPEDLVTGTPTGTQTGIAAGRAPHSDRISNEIEYFKRYLQNVFFRAIFFIGTKFGKVKDKYSVLRVIGFKKTLEEVKMPIEESPEVPKAKTTPVSNQSEFKLIEKGGKQYKEVLEPIKKMKNVPAHTLLEFNFPTSEMAATEGKARALLGVKHGSLVDTLDLPREEIAKRLGFGNFKYLQLKRSEEKLKYPETLTELNQEANQERIEGEGRNPQNIGKKNSNDRQREADQKKKRQGKEVK